MAHLVVGAQCSVDLGPDKDLCPSGVVELSPESINVTEQVQSQPERVECKCPPGYTQYTQGFSAKDVDDLKICAIGRVQLSISVKSVNSLSLYACGGAYLAVGGKDIGCLDAVALNGSDVVYTGIDVDDAFMFVDASSTGQLGSSVGTAKLYSTGGDLQLNGKNAGTVSMVGPACGGFFRDGPRIGSYKTIQNLYTSGNVNTGTFGATAGGLSPLDPRFSTSGGCGGVRDIYGPKAEVCGDGLDNDFDCSTDEDCFSACGVPTYSWRGPNGVIGSSESITVFNPGTYTLTVQDCEGCIATDEIIVTKSDADNDGVCDSDDVCEGFDDNMDADGDGIPDGCDCPTTITIEDKNF